jgi:hypothetical protein
MVMHVFDNFSMLSILSISNIFGTFVFFDIYTISDLRNFFRDSGSLTSNTCLFGIDLPDLRSELARYGFGVHL